jgi:arylsulfatase
MMKRSTLISAALVAVGAIFGWAVASGHLDVSRKAAASVERTQPADAAAPAAGGEAGLKPAELALIVAHNEKVAVNAQKDGKKPNICIIWGDDIGQSNISAYSHGVMGYKTPNIDRVALEGMMFTDY